jgi:hypothetical protein
MRINVRTNDGKNFKIPAPLWLVKGALSLGSFGVIIGRKYIPENSRQYVDAVDFRELRKGLEVLKDYKGLKLVEVKANDGTEVTITV